MTGNLENGSGRRGNRWRIAGWTAGALILLLPLIAMQFTDEVDWDLADFVIFGGLLASVGIACELTVRASGNAAYRAAAGFALAAAFLLVWVNGAVGIIGSENNDANLLYVGVVGVGFFGALIARFRPAGMSRAMFAAALAQGLVAMIAVIGRLGYPESGPTEILLLNGFFVVLFVLSASLFRNSARANGPHTQRC